MQQLNGRSSSTAGNAPAGPSLSPAEFAVALTELYSRPSLQSLCDATAHLGTAALGPTWVALLSRSANDDPLRPTAASGPEQARWPVDPPQVEAECLPSLFARLDDRAQTAGSIALLLSDALSAQAAGVLQDALRPHLAALAPVVVDGQATGAVLVATRGDVPSEAVIALAEHAAAAMRGLLQIDRARAHGDRDAESELLNRSAFERTAAQEMMRARRYGRPLSLIVITPLDLARQSLRTVGQEIKRALRETDILGRLDDERLVVLLPETEREAAQGVGRRLRDQIVEARVGVANHPADGTTWEALLAAAAMCRGALQRDADSAPPRRWQPTASEPGDTRLERFPQHDGPPPRLRDVFPSFRSRAAG